MICRYRGLLVPSDRSRYFWKLATVVTNFVLTVLIPYARGRIRGRPTAELIAEAEAATEAGYGEIVLSGIHLGRYGEDLQEW